MTVRYLVLAPSIPGQDLTFPSPAAAQREQRAMIRAGHNAQIVEVLRRK